VPPAAAAAAWAGRARAAGAKLAIGTAVEAVEVEGGRATGVRTPRGVEPAGVVVLAAGPWTAELAPAPVAALWGVNVEVRLPDPPRHVLEQAGIDALLGAGGGARSIFSIVTAGGVSAVGSTFLPEEPDPERIAPLLLERGARYLPALAQVAAFSARACPRPQSADTRPLLGPHAQIADLHLATGHGAWGISLGPGSAELVAAAILDGAAIPPELAAARG
jgi:glycine/D-amino acid oxidase-like deaminating enzyme